MKVLREHHTSPPEEAEVSALTSASITQTETKKKILLTLRFILILVTVLVITYSKRGLRFPEPGYTIALFYFVSNLILYFLPEKFFSKPIITFLIFLFDIITISVVVYIVQGFETDFYIVYFLVIFAASVSQGIVGSIPIAAVASIIYAWLMYRSNPDISFFSSQILLRIPLLFTMTLMCSYWSATTRRELKKKEELERFSRELEREIGVIAAAEIELRRYHEKILNSVPSGVIATRKDGIITTLNPEAERVLCLKKDEVTGYNIKNIPGLGAFWKKMEQAIKSGITVKRDEVVIKNKENEKTPIGISISSITDIKDKFSGCVAIFKDLSEIRRLEEKLRQAEKLSYLGKMASWVAHEIRNPLTAIDGFAQLLNSKVKYEKIGLYSSEIRKGTERINYIIDDILSFARTKKKVKYVDINLRELIQSIIKSIVHIKITISGDKSPVIKGDIESIRRVFVNLINNSAEAMDEDGRLKINFSSNKKMILTEIIDNGKGIPKEHLKNIFTPFFTTKQRGTGLGLSIVQKIIEEHNGKIEVESEEGVGTTCRVYLPKTRNEKA